MVDAEFSDDLETALRDAGFVPPDSLKLDVYDEVRQEREVQDRKWGGPAHDDQHSGRRASETRLDTDGPVDPLVTIGATGSVELLFWDRHQTIIP